MFSRAVRMGMALVKLREEHGTDFVTRITVEKSKFVLRLRPPRDEEEGGFTQILSDDDSLHHEGSCQRLADWLAEQYGWNAKQAADFCQELVQYAAGAQEGLTITYRSGKTTRSQL